MILKRTSALCTIRECVSISGFYILSVKCDFFFTTTKVKCCFVSGVLLLKGFFAFSHPPQFLRNSRESSEQKSEQPACYGPMTIDM